MSENISKCPVLGGSSAHGAVGTTANQHWWPNQLNLKILQQNPPSCDPMGENPAFMGAKRWRLSIDTRQNFATEGPNGN